jgi:hypothetical protein
MNSENSLILNRDHTVLRCLFAAHKLADLAVKVRSPELTKFRVVITDMIPRDDESFR